MPFYQKKKFLVILISPSAGGKSTVARELLKDRTKFSYSISYTTRSPRGNEQNGIDYHFIDETEFKKRIEKGFFLEYARVHNNWWYGTSLISIKELLEQNHHVVLDIDVQGALQIKSSELDFVSIFLLPPDRNVLIQRLRDRGTDSEEIIQTRLKTAIKEIDLITSFDYLVINDDLDNTIEQVLRIIVSEENKTKRYKNIKNIFYGG